MGGKTPHLEGEGWVELIIFQLNNFDSCTRQISASFGIFNIFINLEQVLKDRGLLLKSNERICAFIKKKRDSWCQWTRTNDFFSWLFRVFANWPYWLITR